VTVKGPLAGVPPVVVLQLAVGFKTLLADVANKPESS
jgi:hypothetical protein